MIAALVLFCLSILVNGVFREWDSDGSVTPYAANSASWPASRVYFSHASDYARTRWYIFGGSINTTTEAGLINDAWMCHMNRTWEQLGNFSHVSVASEGDYFGNPVYPPSSLGSVLWLDSSLVLLWKFSGRLDSGGFLQDVMQLDVETNLWTTYDVSHNFSGCVGYNDTTDTFGPTNVPSGRSRGVYATVDDKHVLFGVYGVDETCTVGALADLWEFDEMTAQFRFVSGSLVAESPENVTGVLPPSLYDSAFWTTATHLYFFGGVGPSGARTNAIWRLDVASWDWEVVVPDSTPNSEGTADYFDALNHPKRRSGSFVAVSSVDPRYVYMYGGVTDSGAVGHVMWIFDSQVPRWACSEQDEATLPWEIPTAGDPGTWSNGVGFVRDETMYMFGGYSGDDAQSPAAYSTLFNYDFGRCYGLGYFDPAVCANQAGTCVDFSICSCGPTFYGDQCREKIPRTAEFDDGHRVKVHYWTEFGNDGDIPSGATFVCDTLFTDHVPADTIAGATCQFNDRNLDEYTDILVTLSPASTICPNYQLKVIPWTEDTPPPPVAPVLSMTVTTGATVITAPAVRISRHIGYCENRTLLESFTNPGVRPLRWEWEVTAVGSDTPNYGGSEETFWIDPLELVAGQSYTLSVKVTRYCFDLVFAEDSVPCVSRDGEVIEEPKKTFAQILAENIEVAVVVIVLLVAVIAVAIVLVIGLLILIFLKFVRRPGGPYSGQIPDAPSRSHGQELKTQSEDAKDAIVVDLPVGDEVFDLKRSEFKNISRVRSELPGVVFAKAVRVSNQEVVGIRIFNTTYCDAFDVFFREFEEEFLVMKKFQHGNVAQVLGIYNDYPRIGIVTEFYHRTVAQLVRMVGAQKVSIPWRKKVKILLDIACGVKYLHDSSCVHRRLSLECVLIDPKNRCKISDFVLSKYLLDQAGDRQMRKFGSYYQAPELTIPPEGKMESPKSDVYSLGIMMFELLVEKLNPYEQYGFSDIAGRCAEDETFRPIIPRGLPPETSWYVDLMKDCYQGRAYRRPHIDSVVEKIQQNYSAICDEWLSTKNGGEQVQATDVKVDVDGEEEEGEEYEEEGEYEEEEEEEEEDSSDSSSD